jgi:hypothetical protein
VEDLGRSATDRAVARRGARNVSGEKQQLQIYAVRVRWRAAVVVQRKNEGAREHVGDGAHAARKSFRGPTLSAGKTGSKEA